MGSGPRKGFDIHGQDGPTRTQKSDILSLEPWASHFFCVSSSVPSVISVVQLLRVCLRALRGFAVVLGCGRIARAVISVVQSFDAAPKAVALLVAARQAALWPLCLCGES
jgi:hypothetical protein